MIDEVGKVKDESYYQISGWMLNRLQLKGNALNVFAIIYGFSQDGESEFTGSINYLCEFIGASRPTVIKALKDLVDAGLLLKKEEYKNNVKFNAYKANLLAVKKLNWGSKETLPPSKETLSGGSKETLPNNIAFNNIADTLADNIGEERKKAAPSGYDALINETLWSDNVKAAIYEFIKMRKLIKKPMTDYALKKLLNKLERLSNGNEATAIAILDNSITNNWQDIYALKDEAPKKAAYGGGNIFMDIAEEEGVF